MRKLILFMFASSLIFPLCYASEQNMQMPANQNKKEIFSENLPDPTVPDFFIINNSDKYTMEVEYDYFLPGSNTCDKTSVITVYNAKSGQNVLKAPKNTCSLTKVTEKDEYGNIYKTEFPAWNEYVGVCKVVRNNAYVNGSNAIILDNVRNSPRVTCTPTLISK